MSETPASGPLDTAAARDAQAARSTVTPDAAAAAKAAIPGPKAASGANEAAAAKAPARPVSEIRADIEKERAELSRSFEALRGDLDEAVEAGKQRAADARQKAKIVGPVVAGVVASLVVARMMLKRRSRKEK